MADDTARPMPAHEHAPKKCRSCQAPIFWARTKNGKSIPVDAEPTAAGNVQLVDRDGAVIANMLGKTEAEEFRAKAAALKTEPRLRTPHHMTCPQASEWRTGR